MMDHMPAERDLHRRGETSSISNQLRVVTCCGQLSIFCDETSEVAMDTARFGHASGFSPTFADESSHRFYDSHFYYLVSYGEPSLCVRAGPRFGIGGSWCPQHVYGREDWDGERQAYGMGSWRRADAEDGTFRVRG